MSYQTNLDRKQVSFQLRILSTTVVVRVGPSVWCVCVCLFVRTITFERNGLKPRYLAHWFILNVSLSSSKVKVHGHRMKMFLFGYGWTSFSLFVQFFVVHWSMRPRVRAFYSLTLQTSFGFSCNGARPWSMTVGGRVTQYVVVVFVEGRDRLAQFQWTAEWRVIVSRPSLCVYPAWLCGVELWYGNLTELRPGSGR